MPCDSRTYIRTAYAAKGLRNLLKAAERLGWKVAHAQADGMSVTVESKDGAWLTVTPGRCDISYGSETEAGQLMQEYARATFEGMVESSPDLYEQVETGPSQSVYNIKRR